MQSKPKKILKGGEKANQRGPIQSEGGHSDEIPLFAVVSLLGSYLQTKAEEASKQMQSTNFLKCFLFNK